MSTKYSNFQAPNGNYYEQNDIDYLMNNGYTLKDALDELSKIDKYRKKAKKSKDIEGKSRRVKTAKKLKKAKTAAVKLKRTNLPKPRNPDVLLNWEPLRQKAVRQEGLQKRPSPSTRKPAI